MPGPPEMGDRRSPPAGPRSKQARWWPALPFLPLGYLGRFSGVSFFFFLLWINIQSLISEQPSAPLNPRSMTPFPGGTPEEAAA